MNDPAVSPQATQIGHWSDAPVNEIAHDHFGFRDFADVLATLATEAETPITMGIFGKWGTGKTSLLSLTQNSVRIRSTSAQPITAIWINPWQYDSEPDLGIAFLQAVLVELRRSLSWTRRLRFDIEVLSYRLRVGPLILQLLINSYRIAVAALPILLTFLLTQPATQLAAPRAGNAAVSTAALTTSVVLALWLILKPLLEAAKGAVSIDLSGILKAPTLEARISELTRLKHGFSRLLTATLGQAGRLVVLVDDLDRCSPDRIPPLFEAMALFAGTTQTVFILALDSDTVAAALAHRYSLELAQADQFLHKMIHIPFSLPPLDPARLSRFIRIAYPDVYLLSASAPAIFAQALEPNPRTVKRAINRYRSLTLVSRARAQAWEIDPIHPELLAKLVALESRLPHLYKLALQEPSALRRFERFAHEPLPFSPKLLATYRLSSSEATSLKAIFESGDTTFSSEPLSNSQIAAYFHLITPSTNLLVYTSPAREDQNDLLSGDQARIAQAVSRITIAAGQTPSPRVTIDAYARKLISVLEHPGSQSPTEVSSANLALGLFEASETADSISAFQHCVERLPRDPSARRLLANIYLDANRFRDAANELQVAEQLESIAATLSRKPSPSRPLTWRRLTSMELAQAQRVFGLALDYSKIRIIENARWVIGLASIAARIRRQPAPAHNAVTLGNTLCFSRRLRTSTGDFGSRELGDVAWLIHELTHVWQSQRLGRVKILAKLVTQQLSTADPYDYGGRGGLERAKRERKSIQDFSLEQQAEIARDYYFRLMQGRDPKPWDRFARQFADPNKPE